MKKLTAVILAFAMMILPMMGLAASPSELVDEAISAGQSSKTTITLGKAAIPGLGEEETALVNDVLTALGMTIDWAQGDAPQLDLGLLLSGNKVVNLSLAKKGGDLYLKSNLLDDNAWMVNTAKLGDAADRLLDYLVKSGVVTQEDVDSLKASIADLAQQMNAQAASLDMSGMDLSDLDATALINAITELTGKVQTGEVTAQPKNSDPAATAVTITLTGEDFAKIIKALVDTVESSADLVKMLDQANLTMDDKPVTAKEMLTKFDEAADQLAGSIVGEIPMEIYLDADGVPVYAKGAITVKADDDTITMEADYARLTTAAGVGHAVNMIATDAQQDGVSMTVNAVTSAVKDNVRMDVASIEEGAATPVMALDVVVDKAYGDAESKETVSVTFDVIDGDETVTIGAVVDQSAKKAEDATVTSESKVTMKVTAAGETLEATGMSQTVTGAEIVSIATEDAVNLTEITEDEFKGVMDEVMVHLQNALVGLLQNLPESILNQLMAQ